MAIFQRKLLIMHKTWNLITVAAVMLCFSNVFAMLDSYSDDNRNLYVAPRSLAMGSSAASTAGDALPTSNAAGLCFDTSARISLSYAGYYENAFSTTGLSFVKPLGKKTSAGISLAYLDVPNIRYNSESVVDSSGTFVDMRERTASASEVYLTIDGAHEVNFSKSSGLSIGGALHGMRRKLPDEHGNPLTGYGIGLDAGLILFKNIGNAHIGQLHLGIGIDAKDITTDYIQWTKSYSNSTRPQIYIDLPVVWSLPYLYGDISLCLRSADLAGGSNSDMTSSSDAYGVDSNSVLKSLPRVAVGLEYRIKKVVSLRGGMDVNKRFSFGAGLSLFRNRLDIDMAYAIPSGLPGTYVLAAGWSW